MKKKLLYIFIPVILLILAFASAEVYSYIQLRIPELTAMNKEAKANDGVLRSQRYAPVKLVDQNSPVLYDRERYLGNENKNTIIFFGGWYTYGLGLKSNETIPAIISKKTGRTAINRALPAGKIQNMLYDLSNPKFYKKMSAYPKTDYIIYTFINDHIYKIVNPYTDALIPNALGSSYYINYGFKDNKGKLEVVTPSKFKRFLYSLYTTKLIVSNRSSKMSRIAGEKIFVVLMTDLKKITDEKFPGSKFVILKYKDGSKYLLEDSTWKTLEKQGFIILDSEKIAGHELESGKWRLEDKEHPSAAANQDVAKGLIKTLGL